MKRLTQVEYTWPLLIVGRCLLPRMVRSSLRFFQAELQHVIAARSHPPPLKRSRIRPHLRVSPPRPLLLSTAYRLLAGRSLCSVDIQSFVLVWVRTLDFTTLLVDQIRTASAEYGVSSCATETNWSSPWSFPCWSRDLFLPFLLPVGQSLDQRLQGSISNC